VCGWFMWIMERVAVEGSVGGYFVFQNVVEVVRFSPFVVLLLDTSHLIEQSCLCSTKMTTVYLRPPPGKEELLRSGSH
jgi:hypothetical protein